MTHFIELVYVRREEIGTYSANYVSLSMIMEPSTLYFYKKKSTYIVHVVQNFVTDSSQEYLSSN